MTTPDNSEARARWLDSIARSRAWLESLKQTYTPDPYLIDMPEHTSFANSPMNDAAQAMVESALELANTLDEHISRMNHPTRPPETRDEALWEQELRDVPR